MKQEIASVANYKAIESDPFFARFSDGIGLLYFLFILFLIALFIFEGIFLNLLGKMWELMMYCCRRGWSAEAKQVQEEKAEANEEVLEEEGLEVVSDDIAKDLSLAALTKFFARVQSEYDDFV